MPAYRIRTRPPRGDARDLKIATGDDVSGYLEDAAHYPGLKAAGVRNEGGRIPILIIL